MDHENADGSESRALDVHRLAYSVEEAGQMIGISRRTIYELIRSGQLVSIKIGSRRLVRHVDLERYLDSVSAAA